MHGQTQTCGFFQTGPDIRRAFFHIWYLVGHRIQYPVGYPVGRMGGHPLILGRISGIRPNIRPNILCKADIKFCIRILCMRPSAKGKECPACLISGPSLVILICALIKGGFPFSADSAPFTEMRKGKLVLT